MKDIGLAILDNSGVVSDDHHITLARVNKTLDYFSKKPVGKEFIGRTFAPSLFEFYKNNFPDLDAEKCVGIHHGLLDGMPMPEPLPGAIDAIKSLYSAGLSLCIFSSHPAYKLIEEHKSFGSFDFFTFIIGDADKSDPKRLNDLILLFKLPRDKIMYIGDTTIDARLAKMTGINFYAIQSDYQSYSQLVEVIPKDKIFKSLKEIADSLLHSL
ncbi:HAD family hydrolase [Candidatus Woesearchaeota archaeon]|nr:HAD family hydrolase [Candidatus Woesearchaeota archaeon]